jgi:LEA14-like dessication related protein
MTRSRRRRPRLLHLLPALAALAFFPGCALFQKIAGAAFDRPKLTYESWTAEALDLEGVTIALHYQLQNPNGFGLDLRRVAYKLEVEGHQVGQGELPQGVQIAASGTTPIAFPIRLRWRDIPAFTQVLLTKREVAYRVTGEAGVGSPVGTIGLPFDHQDRVALPRLPSLAVESITVHDASLSNLALDVRLRIENANAFPLPVGALTYGLRVGDQDLLSGGNHPLVAVPAGGHATISVPIRLSVSGAAETVRQLMRGAEVHLRGLADFGTMEVPVDGGARVR